MRREVSRDEFSKGNYTRDNYQNIYTNSFYFTYFLVANSILYLKIFRGNSPDKILKWLQVVWGYLCWGGNFPRERFSIGEFYIEENFHCYTGWGEFPGNIFHGGRISGIIWKPLKIKRNTSLFFSNENRLKTIFQAELLQEVFW